MSINSIESVVKYSAELDKLFSQKSATGFFADNSFGKKFVGAKTVIIPDVDFQGLADYDRNAGFSRSPIMVSNTPYTMTMDRARSLQIDREDMDESGIAALAGKVLGEYVRTKVIPECDAYVLSKLGQIAESRANIIVDTTSENVYETLTNLINGVREKVGYDEELVAFISSGVYGALNNSKETARMIIPTTFKQGEVNFNVNSFNGAALIPVPANLMKYSYEFNKDGGFKADTQRQILMIVCPKKAAHLVKKTENMRVFTPEQNVDADAYKFDYRIYYDAFVKKSELDTVWAAITPEIECGMITEDIEIAIGGEFSLSASVIVGDALEHDLKYQWYMSKSADLSSVQRVADANEKLLNQDYLMVEEPQEFYLFAKVKIDGIYEYVTDVCKVTYTE